VAAPSWFRIDVGKMTHGEVHATGNTFAAIAFAASLNVKDITNK
jgi:hypothetical protein